MSFNQTEIIYYIIDKVNDYIENDFKNRDPK